MSTQINVIVDNGGLSAKAKRQTNANRWLKLERDSQALAVRRSQEALEQRGIEQGTSIDGFRTTSQFTPEEPAAFRRKTGQGFCWRLSTEVSDRLYSLDGTQSVMRSTVRNKPAWHLQPGYPVFPNEVRFTGGSTTPLGCHNPTIIGFGPNNPTSRLTIRRTRTLLLPLRHHFAIFVDMQIAADAVIRYTYPGQGKYRDTAQQVANASQQETNISCYLIGPSTVRQISTPPLLNDVLTTYFMSPFEGTPGQLMLYGGDCTSVAGPGGLPGDGFAYPILTEWDQSLSFRQRWPDSLGLLENYGSFGEYSGATTPAIFSVLTRPQDLLLSFPSLNAALTSREDYATAAELLSGSPVLGRPQVWAEREALAATGAYLQWQGTLPVTWNERPQPPNANYITRSAIPLPHGEELFAFDFCTDSGLSSYCQSKLLELGFTQQDLQP